MQPYSLHAFDSHEHGLQDVIGCGWAVVDACHHLLSTAPGDNRPLLCAGAIQGIATEMEKQDFNNVLSLCIGEASLPGEGMFEMLRLPSHLNMIAMSCSRIVSPVFVKFVTTSWRASMLDKVPCAHAHFVAVECLGVLLQNFTSLPSYVPLVDLLQSTLLTIDDVRAFGRAWVRHWRDAEAAGLLDFALCAHMCKVGVPRDWPDIGYRCVYEICTVLVHRLAGALVVDDDFANAIVDLLATPASDVHLSLYADAARENAVREFAVLAFHILEKDPKLVPGPVYGFYLVLLNGVALKETCERAPKTCPVPEFWHALSALYSDSDARQAATIRIRGAFRRSLLSISGHICTTTLFDCLLALGFSRSFAEPLVAGAEAILKEHRPKFQSLISFFVLQWCLSQNRLGMEYLGATGDTGDVSDLMNVDDVLNCDTSFQAPTVDVAIARALAHEKPIIRAFSTHCPEHAKAMYSLFFLLRASKSWSATRETWLCAVYRAGVGKPRTCCGSV